MKQPCRDCGGTGKVHVWRGMRRRRQLKTCQWCKGRGWSEEYAFADQPAILLPGGGRRAVATDQAGPLRAKPDLLLDDPEAVETGEEGGT